MNDFRIELDVTEQQMNHVYVPGTLVRNVADIVPIKGEIFMACRIRIRILYTQVFLSD